MQYLLFMIFAPIAMAIILFTMGSSFRFRKEPLAKVLLIYFFLVTLLLAANMLEMMTSGDNATIFFARLFHVFFAFIPVVWLVFALKYTGLDNNFPISRIWIFCIIPIVTSVIALTPNLNRAFYRELDIAGMYDLTTIKAVYGPWFWINGAYCYVLLFSGAIIIMRSFGGGKNIYKFQATFVAAGALFPLIANSLFVFRIFPDFTVDFTSIFFAISGIFFFLGIYGFRLLQVVPIARNLIIKNLETGIVVIDNDGRLLDYNIEAERRFGFKETDIGTPPDENSPFISFIQIKPDDIHSTEIESIDKKIDNFIFNIQIKRMAGSTRHNMGSIITVRDITEEVRLLEEKTESVKQLEKINEELHQTQMRLIHREKLATIGQFSAGIAHELNNPLSYIKSNFATMARYQTKYAEQILSYIKTHPEIPKKNKRDLIEVLKDFGSILSSSNDGFQRISEIIKNLLSFSRVDTQKGLELYDISKGLNGALMLLFHEYKYFAKVDKDYKLIEKIECRASEINQALLNIITNAVQAIKANPEIKNSGKIGRIIISTIKEGDNALISIFNTHSYIPEENLTSIFEPFYTKKIAGQGTGLGLSLAWDIIVKRHKGALWAESEENSVTFYIRLPLKAQ